MVFEDGEDFVEEVEDGEDLGDVAGAEGAVVGGGVGGADEVEDGGAGFGGVEVVGEGGGVVVLTALAVAAAMAGSGFPSRPSGKPPFFMRWWKVRRRSTALVDSVRPSRVKFIWLR